MSWLPAKVRRSLKIALAAVLFVLLVGATYQGVATALERREYPRLGGMVSVGSHQLHIHCTGDGAPTVVLEAPAGGLSAAWGEVQPRVADGTRVCSYDRGGLGWSESGDSYDPARVAGELRALLTNAEVPGPFVVVGHGLGAAFARLYAARPDADVAALVLVAPPPADPRVPDSPVISLSPWLARAGILRAGRILSREAEDLPGTAGGAMRSFLNRPDHLTRTATELDNWDTTVRLASQATVRAGLTTIVVDVPARDPIALLTARRDVDRVVGAIDAAIRLVRASGLPAR